MQPRLTTSTCVSRDRAVKRRSAASSREERQGRLRSPAAGAAAVPIIATGEIEMWADVAESDVIKLAVGQTATVKLAGSTTTIEGKIP